MKQKYNVEEIYTPKGVEIKKVITYNSLPPNAKNVNMLFSTNMTKNL